MRSPYSYTAKEWIGRRCVGDGWQRELVTPFLNVLCVVDPTINVSDIKEKFGTLNIYMSGPEWADKLSDIFEVASEMCCEECGRWHGHHKDGDPNWGVTAVTTSALPRGYWVKTLCNRCRDEAAAKHAAEAEESERENALKRGDVA